MSLCLFQGTFNPIHQIHLDVASYALENYDFDKIIFIPAYVPPHKDVDKELANHRFRMVELATKFEPRFEISDIEYKRGGKSYTYLTVLELKKIYNTDINFLIGTDAFEKIETWYEVDKLKELVHFIVFQRREEFNKESFDYLKSKGYDFEFADKKFVDVSSTSIRNSYIGTGIKEVEEYIREHGLYK